LVSFLWSFLRLCLSPGDITIFRSRKHPGGTNFVDIKALTYMLSKVCFALVGLITIMVVSMLGVAPVAADDTSPLIIGSNPVGSPALNQSSDSIVITSDNASEVTRSSACLNGTLVSMRTGISTEVYFQWGTTGSSLSSGQTLPQKMSQPGTFQARLSGLLPDTEYYFIARSLSYGTPSSEVVSFRTLPGPGEVANGPVGSRVWLLTSYINYFGIFSLDTSVTSEDGNLQLSFSKGVQTKTATGGTLSLVSLDRATGMLPLPLNTSFASLVYDIGPEDATFDPPITLSLAYIPSIMPKGLTEEQLSLVRYDKTSGEWVEVAGTIDIVSHRIKATINRFSRFAVIARERLPSFVVSDLTVSPTDIKSGDAVSIDVRVTNQGDLTGSYRLTLKVNGSVVEFKDIELTGGTDGNVSFTTTNGSPGTYTVDVNGLSGTFLVDQLDRPAAGASFDVSDLNISTTQVNVGQPVEISALVTNSGDLPGNFTAAMTVNGVLVDSKEVDLAGGASRRVSFSTSANDTGRYTVDLSGLSTEFVIVAAEIPPAKKSNMWLIVAMISVLVIAVPATVFVLKRRRGKQPRHTESVADLPPRPAPPQTLEIGTDIKWTEVVGHAFRVIDFDRNGTTIDKNGKVMNPNRFLPYGYLLVESPVLNGPARLPIIHRDDFRLAVNAFDLSSTADSAKENELLITYLPKDNLPEGIPGFAHAIHFAITKKHTLERYYQITSRKVNPEPQRIFAKVGWEGELKVEVNLNPSL
jgi:hypothetical protein